MARFLAGLAMLLLTVAAAIRMIGGRAVLWLHPAVMAFLFVAVVPWCAALAVWPRKEIAQAFRAAFEPAGESRALAASKVLTLLEHLFYASGALALFSGLIITFSQLDSDLPRLGAKLAASLVTPFYALLLALAARILRVRVEQVQGGEA